jgi:hypothetical protein
MSVVGITGKLLSFDLLRCCLRPLVGWISFLPPITCSPDDVDEDDVDEDDVDEDDVDEDDVDEDDVDVVVQVVGLEGFEGLEGAGL